jgi:hypothetical protein
MQKYIIQPGELIHVIHRFEKEVKRHFVGAVEGVQENVVRASGYAFVVDDPRRHEFVKRPDRRVKLIPLTDGELVINVLPKDVSLEDVRYEEHDHRLYVTDGRNWRMDLKEFGWN